MLIEVQCRIDEDNDDDDDDSVTSAADAMRAALSTRFIKPAQPMLLFWLLGPLTRTVAVMTAR